MGARTTGRDAANAASVVNLNAVARDVVRTHGRDTMAFGDEVLRRASRDRALRDALLWQGAMQMLRSLATSGRHRLGRPMSATEKAARAADRLAPRYWDRHWLYGRECVLGDATRADLLVSAESFGKQEEGHGRMRRFHATLADGLSSESSTKRVRDHYVPAFVENLAVQMQVAPEGLLDSD
jgi:hypothetical protein